MTQNQQILRNLGKTGKWGVFIENRQMRREAVSKTLFRTRFWFLLGLKRYYLEKKNRQETEGKAKCRLRIMYHTLSFSFILRTAEWQFFCRNPIFYAFGGILWRRQFAFSSLTSILSLNVLLMKSAFSVDYWLLNSVWLRGEWERLKCCNAWA